MRNFIKYSILFLLLGFVQIATPQFAYHSHSLLDHSISSAVFNTDQTVYVCTGSYAYAYHSQSNCPGLNNCKGQIQYTNESHAVYTMGRRPCCRCWADVQNGSCKDDNPTYGTAGGGGGGGGDAETYAYIALAVVVTGALILSNDMYIYPIYSLDNTEIFNKPRQPGAGWAVGFRKTFDNGAIEYGASFIRDREDGYLQDLFNFDVGIRAGGHLNAITYFGNRSPYSPTKAYWGTSFNFLENSSEIFGYGGILGIQRMVNHWLSFDARYEITNQTNRVQLGLIMTYQEEYFWKR